MLGSLILYLRGMRIMMFQLSGIHYKRKPQRPLRRTAAAAAAGLAAPTGHGPGLRGSLLCF